MKISEKASPVPDREGSLQNPGYPWDTRDFTEFEPPHLLTETNQEKFEKKKTCGAPKVICLKTISKNNIENDSWERARDLCIRNVSAEIGHG